MVNKNRTGQVLTAREIVSKPGPIFFDFLVFDNSTSNCFYVNKSVNRELVLGTILKRNNINKSSFFQHKIKQFFSNFLAILKASWRISL